jgi:hypothetical protein
LVVRVRRTCPRPDVSSTRAAAVWAVARVAEAAAVGSSSGARDFRVERQ